METGSEADQFLMTELSKLSQTLSTLAIGEREREREGGKEERSRRKKKREMSYKFFEERERREGDWERGKKGREIIYYSQYRIR